MQEKRIKLFRNSIKIGIAILAIDIRCFPSSQMSHRISKPVSMTVGSATVSFSNSAKNLGFSIDRHLEMKIHVQNVVRAANFEFAALAPSVGF